MSNERVTSDSFSLVPCCFFFHIAFIIIDINARHYDRTVFTLIL